MVTQTLEAEIREQLNQLPPEQQHQVLEFARLLVAARVRGTPGKSLLRFIGSIRPLAKVGICPQVWGYEI
jgi:hypothetical protein